jgi:cytochrome c2
MAPFGRPDGEPNGVAIPRSKTAANPAPRLNRWLATAYLLIWHAAGLGVLALIPYWRFGVPAWSLPLTYWAICAAMGAAFVVSAGFASLLCPASGWRSLLLAALFTTAFYGLVFLSLFLTRNDFSRGVVLAVFVAAIALIVTPRLLPPSWPWRALALAALLAIPAVDRAAPRLAPELIERWSPTHASIPIRSSYYNLTLDIYQGPKSAVHGGALGRIGNRYILMTGDGHLYLFGPELHSEGPSFARLPYRVPLNGKDFAASAGRPWATNPGEVVANEWSGGDEVLSTEYFRTYGLLVQDIGADSRIFASHAYWRPDRACFVERVSVLEGNRDAILRGAPDLTWKTLYETSPCLPVHGEGRRHGIPFVGYFGGGRIQLLDPQTILLSVGDFGFDGVASIDAVSQDLSSSYGKTIAIKIADGSAEPFTIGHRNPQGLFIDQAGNIWSTEHGPRGGDKLNRLVQGGNYGWPYATFGTDYGSFNWPLNTPEADWSKYQDPIFAWVPSIGVSNLLVVQRNLFPRWRGDLLIGSLKAKTLFRAHVRNDHVLYFENLTIGSRIRDLIEGYDGRVLLWTDDDTLIVISPNTGSTGETLFAEKCSGCHQSTAHSGNRIGPNLAGVFGRRVASLGGYPDYSPAMRHLGGTWTNDRLDAFLKSPADVCPGTNMDMNGVHDDRKRSAIITYLQTLR